MSKTTVLNERVTGRQFAVARHPRVELPNVASLLRKKMGAPFSLDASAAPEALLEALAQSPSGALLVVEAGVLNGIVSEREVVQQLRARGAMRLVDLARPCTQHATPGDTLEDCIQLVVAHDLRYLAVIDEAKPVGLFSREELLAEKVAYLERICKENELDLQVAFLRGTYSC